MFRHYKNGKITHPQNVVCLSKQLFYPYQTVFLKNDNWRVYGVDFVNINVYAKFYQNIPNGSSDRAS